MASKKKRSSGFLWGLIIGVIVTVGAIYYYNNNSNKSDFEKGSKKIERKAKKELNKAEDGVKRIFEK